MAERPFVTARWVDIVMLNYEVDPAILEPYVPVGTELDAFEGRHLVSLVGFRFLNTAVRGLRVPFHGAFEEVNLRLYVRREANGEGRRGVVFVKEIVPRAAVTWVANTVYNERYVTLPMRHTMPPAGEDGVVGYEWRHAGKWCRLAACRAGEAHALVRGSEPEFIAEHYYGYVAQRDGSALEYRVDHPPWRVWQGIDAQLELDVRPLYGAAFAAFLHAPPASSLIAEGSEVAVYRGSRFAPE